ncbi:MAG: family metallopeptidase [Microbacteriaceae bacterium]|nr:family metallopeptidase [Microbacteriaceae bacterium]
MPRALLVLALTIALAIALAVVPGAPVAGARVSGGPASGAPLAAVAAASVSAEDPQWSWPVAPPHAILRPFIAPATAYAAGHRGIDIAFTGTTVTAPADGVVHFSGVVVDRPVLSIEHADGVLSSFEPVTSTLGRGDPVRRGDVVGVLVAGHCSSPCLHLGARRHGEYISPLALLGGLERSVLLPTRRARPRRASAPVLERAARSRPRVRVRVRVRAHARGCARA